MTYTVIGRCERTGRFGIGIATYSLAVGGYCPFLKRGVGVVSSQAAADPRLGSQAMRLLERGASPEGVLDELGRNDDFFEYRQIGVLDWNGNSAAHTGLKNREWRGHIVDGGSIAMGNGLAGAPVADAIAGAFRAHDGESLDERLLRALEAGRDAGGQAPPEVGHLPERSAALVVYGEEEYALMDLRVDAHEMAVEELRRVRDAYLPYVPLYYDLRVKRPDQAPPQEVWPVE